MKYVMLCEEVELVHVTTEDRLGSILETGIRPSAFGDMAVGEDDGAGVYAVRNDARLIQKVLDYVVDTETLGYVYAVKFRYKGRYRECVDSVEHSSHGTTHTGAYRSKIVVEKFDNYLAAQNVMDDELRMVFGWEKLPDEPLTTNYDIGGLEAWALHNGVSHSWKIVVVEVEVTRKVVE